MDDSSKKPPSGDEPTLTAPPEDDALAKTLDSGEDAALAQTQDSDDGQAPRVPGQDLRRGDSLGRYLVVSTLGAGGMGVVYEGYDPDLHRQVALKLLHPRSGQSGSETDAHSRLMREAQAMARLSHPNIITVYDVGAFEGRVYVAMEKVEGHTLTEWLAREERSVEQTVDVFIQAAEGLAEAHRAGLVHRDFKPDNVLVGQDGRVRVMDFGLARQAGEPTGGGDAPSPPRDETPLLESPLTRTGALLGTPAYMSPEQHRGEPADARSDQFGFCVALFEALHGKRPFAGTTLGELARAASEGEIAQVEDDDHLSPVLKEAVRRGLSPDPASRFDTMDDLVRELRRGRKGIAKAWYIGAAAVIVGIIAATWTIENMQRSAEHEQNLIHKTRRKEREVKEYRERLDFSREALADTRERLKKEKKQLKRVATHFDRLRKRRLDLLEGLRRARTAASREAILCQIAGLEDVIKTPGDKKTPPLARALRQTLRRCLPMIRACYHAALKEKPGLAGTIGINVKTNTAGLVTRVSFPSDTVGSAELQECLRRKVSAWYFPTGGGAKALDITYPFTFKPPKQSKTAQ